MKNFKFLLSVAVASAMFGCSSMDVEEEEALSENFPADFSKSEYMEIHPQLLYLQYKDYVTYVNDSFKDASGEAFAELKSADSAAFDADVVTLEALYKDPFVGGVLGYATEWETDNSAGTRDSLVPETVKHYLNVTVVDGETPSILVIGTWDTKEHKYVKACETCEVTLDSAGAIVKVVGLNKAEEVADFTIGETVTVSQKDVKTRLDTLSMDTIKVATEGGVPADKMKQLRAFNFYETTDDLGALKKMPIDTSAIINQYVVFGRLHGWGYRRCTEAEKANPIITEEYPTKKVYCDDNGTAREIKK
ncbi:MAG: hypothetical protein MJZ26_03165 [Fibrobacter sp.]|nr:hypothetical protein [Fibrobacter sp.]